MRVFLTSHGSTGDIYPMIRLARALMDAGHSVRFATTPFFRADIERAGVTYVHMPPDWDQASFAEAMRDLTRAKSALETLAMIYRESAPYADEIFDIIFRELSEADVFVSSYVFAPLCQLARMSDVPSAVTMFAHHVVPSPLYPPEKFPRLLVWPRGVRRPWNRALWHLADFAIIYQLKQVISEACERNQIPFLQSFLREPADRVLVTVSPGLFEPKKVWNDRFHFTGYLRWQAAENPVLDEELKAFTGGQRVPILNFGSVTFENTRHVMLRFMQNWPAGAKIIVQSGWAGLNSEANRPDVKFIGKVSHDQLFQHASVVIHHGGAGTTASALHAGIPQIIVPHIGDQWFFASEMERLGVGLELKRKRWPEQLPKAVRKVLASRKMHQRAREAAAQLAQENGPANAVAQLEALFAEGPRPSPIDPPQPALDDA